MKQGRLGGVFVLVLHNRAGDGDEVAQQLLAIFVLRCAGGAVAGGEGAAPFGDCPHPVVHRGLIPGQQGLKAHVFGEEGLRTGPHEGVDACGVGKGVAAEQVDQLLQNIAARTTAFRAFGPAGHQPANGAVQFSLGDEWAGASRQRRQISQTANTPQVR